MDTKYNQKTRFLYFFPTLLILILLDQWSKIWAVESLKGQFPKTFLLGTAQLTYAENTGAWGNLGGNWGEPWRTIFLIVLPIAVLLGMAAFGLFSKAVTKKEFWAYTLIAAGGLGNLIDRIRLGYVVDFMYLGIKKPFETNIFNVADVVIMTGFGLMLLHLFQDWRSKKDSKNNDSPEPPIPPKY